MSYASLAVRAEGLRRVQAQRGPGAHTASLVLSPPYAQVSPNALVSNRPLSTNKFSFNLGGEQGAGRGYMKLFQNGIQVLLEGCTVLAPPDVRGAVVLQVSDDAFAYLDAIQYAIKTRLIDTTEEQLPNAYSPVFTLFCRKTQRGDKNYIKTKLRLVGRRATIGMRLGETEPASDAPVDALAIGVVVNAVVAIDGVYISHERTGLVTRLELFRVTRINENDVDPALSGEPDHEDDVALAERRALCMQL